MSEHNGEHIFTREDFFAAVVLPRELIAVPGYGKVWIRGLTAEEREQWEASPRNRLRATMIALAACDEAGKSLFTMADVGALGKMPAAFMMPLFDAAIRLSKVGKGDIDGLEKDSGATPDDSSVSALPAISV